MSGSVSTFTRLLVELSEDLVSDDLKTMKIALQLDNHLQARELEEATKGIDVFLLLKKRGLLGADNLTLLKSVLETINRHDLGGKVSEFANRSPETPVCSAGPVLQETGFEGNFGELDSSRQNSRLQFISTTEVSPDVLLPQTSATSDNTLLKERLLLCSNESSVLPSDQTLQPPEEQNLSTSGSSARNRPSEPFQCGLVEELETDGNAASDLLNGAAFSEKRGLTGGEFVNLAEKDSLLSEGRECIYLRDDRSLDGILQKNPTLSHMAGGSTVLKKASLCSYQTGLLAAKTLRGYQLELAEPSLKGLNNIICAPTGSGKTLTAGFIFQEQWKLAEHEKRQFRGLFIVCQRTLVLQQKRALEDFLSSDALVGAVEENQLLQDVLILPYKLIVLTAQKLINALDVGSVKVENFEMLILDECHHTDLNHPYNKIMRFYHKLRRENPYVKLPMIVGLTASLGVGSGKNETSAQQHYINICANLNAICITHVRNEANACELLHFNPKPSEDQISSVAPRPKDSPFYTIMIQLMGKIERESELIFLKPRERGTQTYENWVVDRRVEATKRENLPHIIIACEALEKLNIAWMLHDQLRIKDAKEFLDSYFTPEWLPLQPLPIQKSIFNFYMEASDNLDRLAREETIDQCPQLNKLCKLLSRIHSNHSDARGILLARTRLSVDRLIQFLGEVTDFQDVIFPAKFVGQGGIEGTMTQTAQENTLRRFRLGKEDPARINLLVATDVAQEGLDMPKCNYVIRYNFVSNEIGSVQSRGRARAPNSELYLIVTSGSINEARELENLQKEHQMQKALKIIDTLPENLLQQSIKELQEKNWQDYQSQLIRDRMRASAVDRDLVKIHCSKCKVYLCDAKDIRLRGSNYICIAVDFEDRTYFKETHGAKEFISEIHLGQIFCKARGCPGNKLGLKIKYKQGSRLYGLVLGKDGCVWQMKDQKDFMAIKQWSKVPFTVERETI